MGPLRIAIKVGRKEIWIALLSRKAPQLSLRGFLCASGEIELLGQQRLIGGNLLSARRCEYIVADSDHHAGDVGAGRRHVSKQRLREGTIAATPVKSDVVRLGRKGDEEARQLSDRRQSDRRSSGSG